MNKQMFGKLKYKCKHYFSQLLHDPVLLFLGLQDATFVLSV
jgi:hypothetical protein